VNEVTPAKGFAPVPVGPPFKDRSKGLLVFGIVEIFMGLLCLLLVGIMGLAQMIASRTTDSAFSGRMLLPAVVVYMIMAVVFLWLGVGSIKCRRWARALLLILAWSWLCVGILSLAVMSIVLPRILAAAPTQGQPLPSGALGVIVAVQLVIIGLMSKQFVLWLSSAWLPLLLGYMLWVKRLFRPIQKA